MATARTVTRTSSGWFTDAHWTGAGGIRYRSATRCLAIALLAALAIGVKAGILIGYTGARRDPGRRIRQRAAVARRVSGWCCCSGVFAPVVAGKLVYVLPTIVVLVLLAVPPILTGTYAGIQNADPDAVGAARHGVHQTPDPAARSTAVRHILISVSAVRHAADPVSTATITYLVCRSWRIHPRRRAQANFVKWQAAQSRRPGGHRPQSRLLWLGVVVSPACASRQIHPLVSAVPMEPVK